MTTTSGVALALVLALVWVAPSRAHDGAHTGTSIKGTVEKLEADALRVRTESGEVSITLSARTQIRSGKAPAEREALRPGVYVHVHGSKLPGGGFAAREVLIESPPPREGTGKKE